ncbi:MAG: serine/threonine protein kinase [Phycisphaerae bacterium]|nr:serine/threonine protein kinase [Phycisphaerae bacterium]
MNNQIIDIDGFTIIKNIGTGARTTIYLARDEATKEKVALKRAILENPEDIRIFEQIENEYKVSQNIDHPYIRKCHKIIKRRKRLKVSEVLLSMELFEGRSLEESNSFSLGDILLIFRMIATALNGMHQRGYVHCDIKPNNILISDEGSIKIIDLGQSCKIGAIKSRIQGTPDYIAPEQVHKQHLSHRTDIFNFGATMYWALTGKNVPTLIPQKTDIGMRVDEIKEFRTPRQIYKQIPQKVSDIVMRCVEEKPAKRPENMSEIIATFDGLIRDIFNAKAK